MSYHTIFKDRRKERKMTQTDVAKNIGCSIMTVSFSERPYSETKQLPSESYIKKFVKYFGASAEDRVSLERKLLVERALYTLPPVVADEFRRSLDERAVARSGTMPAEFRARVKKDWTAANKPDVRGFSRDDITSVIDGQRLLSRNEVIALAKGLNASSDRYLTTAQYISDAVLVLFEKFGANDRLAELVYAMPYREFEVFVRMVKEMAEIICDVYGIPVPEKGSKKTARS